MSETILTWNFTNWVTVVVMVTLGYLALALVTQAYHNYNGAS